MPSEHIQHVSRCYAPQVARLPTRPETFKFNETDLSHGELQKLRLNGILERVSSVGDPRPHDWRVTERAHNYVTAFFETVDQFPCCGSRAVQNVDGALQCADCGAPVSSTLFRQVLGTGGEA